MAKKQAAAKVLVKKKRWVSVIAPKLFNEREIGEMHLEEPGTAVNRKLTVSMTTITGEPQKQGVLVSFLITGFAGEKLQTELVGYRLAVSATKRMMRRSRSKIEDSILYQTADNKQVRIKPMLITRARAQGGVRSALRKQMKDYLSKTVTKTPYEQLMRDIISKKFQKGLQDALKKTFPVAIAEVRHIELIFPKKQ